MVCEKWVSTVGYLLEAAPRQVTPLDPADSTTITLCIPPPLCPSLEQLSVPLQARSVSGGTSTFFISSMPYDASQSMMIELYSLITES